MHQPRKKQQRFLDDGEVCLRRVHSVASSSKGSMGLSAFGRFRVVRRLSPPPLRVCLVRGKMKM